MATKKSAKSTSEVKMPTVNDVYAKVVRALKLLPIGEETPREFRERVEATMAKRWKCAVSTLRSFKSGRRRPVLAKHKEFYADLERFTDAKPLAWYQAMPAGTDRRVAE